MHTRRISSGNVAFSLTYASLPPKWRSPARVAQLHDTGPPAASWESPSWLIAISTPLEPANVTMRQGCRYTGDSRSGMYDAIGAGLVDAVKEGKRTMLVFASLKRRVAARKPAAIGKGDPKFRELRKLANPNRRRRHKRKAK